MLRPRLVVGIGGSGGKTIRAMKESIDFRLRQNQIYSFPSCWQFLQIDTTDDGIDFPAKMLSDDEKCIVVRPGQTFGDIRSDLENSSNSREERSSMLTGWGIKSSQLNVGQGAGMIRGIGKQVGIGAARTISSSLDLALTNMHSGSAISDLENIASKLDPSNPQVDKVPQVIIISSLAGGSGAGMFIDVIEILKRNPRYKNAAWIQDAISFLYTAEVFENLKGAADIKQNCLAAVNEITAGSLRRPTDRTELLMSGLSIGDSQSSVIGSPINILIGSKNSSGVDLANGANGYGMNEIFYTVGETLAALTLNPKLSEAFLNQAITNVFKSPFKVTDTSGFAPRTAEATPRPISHPFAAVGFARLSVGTDRTLEFIRDGLLKSQLDTLLYPDNLSPAQLAQRNQTPEMVVEQAVTDAWGGFLSTSNLSEFGEVENDVTDALKNNETEAIITGLVQDSLTSLNSLDRPKPIDRAFNQVWNDYQASIKQFENSTDENIRLLASEWASKIQQHVLDHVATYVSKVGFQVTVGLIKKLREQEIHTVITKDLVAEIEVAKNNVNKATKEFIYGRVTGNANGRQEVSNADKPIIEGLKNDFRTVAVRSEEIRRKTLVIELLSDFSQNFLKQLEETLAQYYANVRSQFKANNLQVSQGINVMELPDLTVTPVIVPAKYRPRVVEKTLIDPSDYFTFYIKHAEKDLPTEMWSQSQSDFAGKSSRVFVLSQERALLGLPLKASDAEDKNNQTLIISKANWFPKSLDMVNASSASFGMEVKLLDLRDRNRDWLSNGDSKFGETLKMSIKNYCTDCTVQEQADRQETFVRAYGELLNISAPLANYAKNAFSVLTSRDKIDLSTQFDIRPDRVPFDRTNSEAGRKVDSVITSFLRSSGVAVADNAYENTWFDPSSTAKELFVMQLPLASLPSYAFGSLTIPILDSMMNSSSPADWKDYWVDRRTRPLLEAIPASEQTVLSMITGFFLAKMFGFISQIDEPGKKGSNYQKVASPAISGRFANFPEPLLMSPIDSKDGNNFSLPAILMSLGLAFVNFSQTGDEKHLHPYRVLKYLGREVTVPAEKDNWDDNSLGDTLVEDYQDKSALLENWILKGDLKDFGSFPVRPAVGTVAGTSDDRIAAINDYLDTLINGYQKLWADYSKSEWNDIPNMWELKDEIDRSLGLIKTRVNDFKMSSAGNSSSLDG